MIYCILNQQVNDSSLYNYVTTGDWADSDIILLYDCLHIKSTEFKLQYHLSTKKHSTKKEKSLTDHVWKSCSPRSNKKNPDFYSISGMQFN